MKCKNDNIPLTACFSIIKQQHFIFLNKILRNEEVTAGSTTILVYLLYNSQACQEDIANRYKIDKGSVARGIRKLEDVGLVCKKLDNNNRRKYVLSLTSEGKRVAEKIIEANKEWEKTISKEVNLPLNVLNDALRQIAKKTIEINNKLENQEDFNG